jgi:two-component system, OmpR family, heavy metal sensor histidine kinase CusS
LIRLSLNARLALLFVFIVTFCLAIVGIILFDALARHIYAREDLSIVLAARHLRRLAVEMDDVEGIREHQDRLVSLVLGDPALALKIEAPDGAHVIDYDPPHLPIPVLTPTPETQRIVTEQLRHWISTDDAPMRGVATLATLRNKATVKISVARSMSDRVAMLAEYRSLIWMTGGLAVLVAAVLSLVLIRHALRPLQQMAASARDVTPERLDARIDLQRAPAELQELALSLNAMLRRLQRGFDRLWEFTTDLAHDLRTPIGNMRGASEVALTRVRSPSEYQALLASNIEECDRMTRMIESVLFLARAESPHFALKRVSFDAADELHRIGEYFEGLAAEAGVDIRIRGEARVSAERELFRRAVSNLLANALRYTPAGGAIVLTAAATPEGTSITVENPGTGIAPSDLDKVFERFYRGDASRSNPGTSSGLGLAIVKTIMELHGGRASVRSDAAGLTAFDLHFPG